MKQAEAGKTVAGALEAKKHSVTVKRREAKYFISYPDFVAMSNAIGKVLERDTHDKGNGYFIRSLYFDTLENMAFEEKMSGVEKRKKLKSEYSGITGKQIVELKKQGIEIDYPLELPIVIYIGDTQYVDFSQLKYIVESKISIAECTFYEDEHSGRAETGKHMHIDEFTTLLKKLKNEHIIITHTTQRSPMREIRKILKNALSKETYDKITILMAKGPS